MTSPLEKGDHPELDTSELLDEKGIEIYQSMIGALQWAVTIGRLDINTAVMTLSGFRVAPRRGHLDRAKRIYGYLAKMRHAGIRVRTDEPDYSDIPDFEYDWSKSVYGELEELKPEDAPEPLGRNVIMSHYVDANLMHDVVSGRSVTGILHLVNKTPLDWYSKKQATVETATYGSEFVAARTCVEQIIDLRTTLRYLGVYVILVFLYSIRAICLVTISQLLIALCKSMPNSIKGTPSYLSIVLESVLHLRWLASTLFPENPTQRISLASIGDIHKFGQDLKHCSFGWEIQLISKNKKKLLHFG